MGRDTRSSSKRSSSKRSTNARRRDKRDEQSVSSASNDDDIKQRPAASIAVLLDRFARLANEEQRAEERTRRDTMTSGATLATFGTRSVRGGSMNESHDAVIKVELLRKQGGKVKSWHTRYFVLKRSGLVYYKDQAAFSANTPLNRIKFVDMQSLSSNDKVAEELPLGMYRLLAIKFVFCVHTDTRTYIIGTTSRESQLDWVKQINKAYHDFHRDMVSKNALLNEVWRLGGSEEIYATANELTKSGTEISEVVDKLFEIMTDDFADKVATRRNIKLARQTFLAWKTFYRYMAAGRAGGAGPAAIKAFPEVNQRSFFKGNRLSRRLPSFGLGRK